MMSSTLNEGTDILVILELCHVNAAGYVPLAESRSPHSDPHQR